MAPGFQGVNLRASVLPLQFVGAIGQITQARQSLGSRAMACLAGILTQSDIASIVRSVLDRGPMTSDDFQNTLVVIFLDLEA